MNHSSFANRRTPGAGESRESSTSGVSPTVRQEKIPGGEAATTRSGVGTAGHRRQHDHAGVGRQRRVEAAADAHVLALDVDVDEAR